MNTLAAVTDKVVEQARQVNGAVDVQASVIAGARFLSIIPDMQQLRHYGVSKQNFSEFLHSQLSGFPVVKL